MSDPLFKDMYPVHNGIISFVKANPCFSAWKLLLTILVTRYNNDFIITVTNGFIILVERCENTFISVERYDDDSKISVTRY